MKTAVSVPDELFHTADEAARNLRMSRSQLYTTALAEFLERRDAAAITARLDKVYAKQSSDLDEPFHQAQVASLDRDW